MRIFAAAFAIAIAFAATGAAAQYSSSYPTGMPNSLTTLGSTPNPAPDLGPSLQPAPAVPGCTGDYRAVALCALKAVLRGYSAEGAEISALKPTHGPQLGDTMTCVKAKGVNGDLGYFAVFLENGKYLDTRRAVAVDGCQGESYALAPALAAPAAAKSGKHRKKSTARR